MRTSRGLLWSVLMLLLAISSTNAEANCNKRTAFELRRWESTGIVNCTKSGFSCKDDPTHIIPLYQRCDGMAQCIDKSDEKQCTECSTPYALNGTDGFLECLTSWEMRRDDGVSMFSRDSTKCLDNAKKELKKSWQSGCSCDETTCCVGQTCVPSSHVCDGVEDCESRYEGVYNPYDYYVQYTRLVGGEDEKNCAECKNGARMCEPAGKCIARKDICDGYNDCADGSDEKDCTCESCTGTRALCGNGQCIRANKVCDGVMDCEDASDEQNCPTSCGAPVTANCTLPPLITSSYDNNRYLESEVCSGAFPEVNHKCPKSECDCRVAFKCTQDNKCIPKEKVCDGVRDCYDGADEQNCIKACLKYPFFTCVNKLRVKCMSMEHKCDGVRDCTDGSDEKKCNKCPSDAHKCDGGCLPGTSRCDGVKDCKDGSDEANCTCEECNEGHLDTYSCEATRTCMKKSSACGPHSKCPKPTARDELFCVRHSQRMATFKATHMTGDSSRYWSN